MMTKLRESVITKLCLMLSFSAFLALQSCSPDDPAHEATAMQPTGEALFAAIFFGYGEAAEQLSIYNEQRAKLGQIPEADRKDVEQRLNKLNAAIAANNPNFFTEFKHNISSGDHLVIREGIKQGAIALYANLDSAFPEMKRVVDQVEQDVENGVILTDGALDKQKLAQKSPQYESLLRNNMISTDDNIETAACSWAVACVFYAALAAHNTVAATANLAIVGAAAIYLAVTFWGPGLEEEAARVEGNLTADILINDIATAF